MFQIPIYTQGQLKSRLSIPKHASKPTKQFRAPPPRSQRMDCSTAAFSCRCFLKGSKSLGNPAQPVEQECHGNKWRTHTAPRENEFYCSKKIPRIDYANKFILQMKVFLCIFAIQEEHTCVRQHSKVPSCHNIWKMRGVNDNFWAHGRVWWCDSTSCMNQRRSRQSPSLMEEWPFAKKCNGKRHRPGSLSLNSEWWLGPKTCNPEKHAVQSKSPNRKWSPSPLDCQMTPAAPCNFPPWRSS